MVEIFLDFHTVKKSKLFLLFQPETSITIENKLHSKIESTTAQRKNLGQNLGQIGQADKVLTFLIILLSFFGGFWTGKLLNLWFDYDCTPKFEYD